MLFSEHSSASPSMPSLEEQLFALQIERRELANGLVHLHQPDFSVPVVSVQVWVRTGSIHEGDLRGSGLSHYLEHMLFKGTDRRGAQSIAREVHGIGGLINAYTTFDRTVYYIDCPATSFDTAVDILSDIVLHSTLPTEETERERDVILREIDMGLDDADQCLSRALFRNAYRRHPYCEPVIGHRELFQQVQHAELSAYYKARYLPNNITVCTAGAVSLTECSDTVDQYFGTLARGRLCDASFAAEPTQLSVRRETLQGDYNITRGGIAFKVPHLSHPDSAPLDALAQALGGGESSVFWENLRNKDNLVHYIDCRNWNPGDSGLFWISYICDPDKQGAVETEVRNQIQQVISEGVEESVLDKAYRQAVNSEINSRKTVSGRASRLGLAEVVVGDVHFTKQYFQQLRSVTGEDLSRVAAHYLIEDGMTAVCAEPRTAKDTGSKDAKNGSSKPALQAKHATLKDGIQIVLQPDPSLPKVHLRAVLLGGAHYEPNNQRGISTLLAEMLIKDTEGRSASEVVRLLETLGGKLSATAGNNSIQLAIEVFPDDLPVAVQLLADAICCPTFEAATFDTELVSQIAMLQEEDDEIFGYGFRLLRQQFFTNHPFHTGPNGRLKDLKVIDRDALKSYYDQIVQPANLVLSACGHFDEDALSALLAKHLEGRLPTGQFKRIAGNPHQPTSALVATESMEREQALLLMAFPDVGLYSRLSICGELLNEICSGMSSRLFERVREEQGLAYYVGSTRTLGLNEGMFTLYAGTHDAAIEVVAGEMREEVRRIVEGRITEDELERCRTRLKAARVMNRQTLGARAMHAGMQLAYGLPEETVTEYGARVDAVNASTLADFASKQLDLEKVQQLTVRPVE